MFITISSGRPSGFEFTFTTSGRVFATLNDNNGCTFILSKDSKMGLTFSEKYYDSSTSKSSHTTISYTSLLLKIELPWTVMKIKGSDIYSDVDESESRTKVLMTNNFLEKMHLDRKCENEFTTHSRKNFTKHKHNIHLFWLTIII